MKAHALTNLWYSQSFLMLAPANSTIPLWGYCQQATTHVILFFPKSSSFPMISLLHDWEGILFCCSFVCFIFIFYFKQQQHMTSPRPFDLRCALFYFAFCCHDWAFWLSTREGEDLFYLQLTAQQGKPRQELKARAWCINHREANKAYWLPGHIQPSSSHNLELGVVWSVGQDLPT